MVEKLTVPGYKLTEIGEIPAEWKLGTLTSVTENENDIIAGPFGSNLKVSDYTNVGVPIIRLQNVAPNSFIFKDIKYIGKEKAKELNYHSFIAGDIVLAKLGDPIGVSCVIPPELPHGIVVADVVRIRVSDKKVDKHFIVQSLNSPMCLQQLRLAKIGSTRPRVNLSDVRNIKLILPALKEQQKIAEILSYTDSLIESLDLLISKKKNIKQGLMQTLLTRGIGHKKFKKTELGEIPEDWAIKHLGELTNVTSGFGFPIRYQERHTGAIPFFKVNDLNASRKVATKSNNYIDEAILRALKAKAYPKGTIIFPKIGMSVYLNKYRILGVDATFDNNVAGVIPLFINGEFLYYYFAGRIKLKTLSGESALPSIRKSTLQKLKVPVPPNVEQESISNILTNLDKEIQSLEQKRDKFKLLKTGMMQQLLTGRIRVK